jgi:hypothetical protein
MSEVCPTCGQGLVGRAASVVVVAGPTSEVCTRLVERNGRLVACGMHFQTDGYCVDGHSRPVREPDKRDFPLGGDFDPDEPYREHCDDGPRP